jgi:hypothetical protein
MIYKSLSGQELQTELLRFDLLAMSRCSTRPVSHAMTVYSCRCVKASSRLVRRNTRRPNQYNVDSLQSERDRSNAVYDGSIEQ